MTTRTLLLVSIIASLLSCDDSISPSAPFYPKMVIYSVLTTQSDTQYVRLHTSYNPSDNQPKNYTDEQTIKDATVTISQAGTTIVLRDTIIPRLDKSRYSSDIHMFYAYPLRVEANKTYDLKAVSPTLGMATASVTVPNVGLLSTISGIVLENPDKNIGRDIILNFKLASNARGFLVRFYVVFNASNPGEPEATRNSEKYFEVPTLRIAEGNNSGKCKIFYPQILKQVVALATRLGEQPPLLGYYFPFPAYNESIESILRNNHGVRFKRAVFYLVQFDEPYYRYYSIVNLSQDRYGVLREEPDNTNISAGVGLFASMRVDSVVWNLPETIRGFPGGYLEQITVCQQENPQRGPLLGELGQRFP